MNQKFSIVLSVLISISIKLIAQNNEKPSINLIPKNINKEFIQKFKNGDYRSIYLGSIKDDKGRKKFYAVREFKRIKAANIYHGISKLLFYNSSKKLVAQYIFDLPDELPFLLKSNELFFKQQDNKIFKVNINGKLPQMLCSPNCYQIQKL